MVLGKLRCRLACAALAVLFVHCSGDGERCFDDRSCGVGKRCDRDRGGAGANLQEPGVCVPCDADEVPYDGIDNDCDPGTRDSDLDGDGDNAANAAVRPGGDCDDMDSTVSSRSPEICGDGKDNNCDGRIDEPECGDMLPPMIAFSAPRMGEQVYGQIEVRLDATDDAGIEKVDLYVADSLLGSKTSGPFSFNVDTTMQPDGVLTLRAVATDIAARTAEATISVVVDNLTPPEITVLAPMPDANHGGSLGVSVMAMDVAGIDRVSFRIGSSYTTTLSFPPFFDILDTATLADGPHTLIVSARDTIGNESTVQVQFKVDNTPPTIQFLAPLPNSEIGASVPVRIEASDASGVRAIASQGRSASSSPLHFTLNARFIADGPWVLTATASDLAIIDDAFNVGNVAVSSIPLIVNNAALEPAIALVDPLNGHGVYRATTIRAQAVAPLGIQRVDFFVDGAQIGSTTTSPFEANHDFEGRGGTALIRATIVDAEGNEATDTATVTVVRAPAFRVAKDYPLQSSASGAYAVGDVTGDGVMDLVLTTDRVEVLTGTSAPNATPKFALAATTVLSSQPAIDVRLIDIEGDGDLDVMVLRADGITLYRNQGGGAFDSGATFLLGGSRNASAFAIGDLDGDSDLDVVLGNSNAGTADIFIMLQTNGQFSVVSSYGMVGQVTDVDLADVDGDSDLDVIVGRPHTGFVTVYRNGGSANFGAGLDSFVGGAPSKVRAVDVTGDGRPELVAMLEGDPPDAAIALLGSAPGSAQFAVLDVVSLIGAPKGLTIADVDNDLDQDVVVAIPSMNGVIIWRNDGGTLASRQGYAMTPQNESPQVADLDNDGEPELLVLGPTRNVLSVAANRGASFGEQHFVAAPVLPVDFFVSSMGCPFGLESATKAPGAIQIGELVGGGLPEIVLGVDEQTCAADPNPPNDTPPPIPPAIIVIRNDGNGLFTPLPQVDLPEGMSPTEIAVGDLDGMNELDLAIGSAAESSMGMETTAVLLRSGGAGNYQMVELKLDKPLSAAIADVDNDGIGEAVFSIQPATGPHGSIVIEADGSVRYTDLIGFGASSIVVGNLDDDPAGFIDFAVANSLTHNVTLYAWTGAGWTRSVYNTSASISALIKTQVSGDSRTDLVGVGESGVILLEGSSGFDFGSPSSWPSGTPSEPFRISQGDFNLDGINDVAVLNADDDALAILLARPQGGYFPPDFLSISNQATSMANGTLYGNGNDIVMANATAPVILFLINETQP